LKTRPPPLHCPTVKTFHIVAAVAVLFCATVYADGERTFKTDDGHTYANAMIIRIEPDGITVQYDAGVAKLSFMSLPGEVQREFKFDYKAAVRYQELVRKAVHERIAREARAEELAELKRQPKDALIQSGQVCYLRVSEIVPGGVLAYVSPLTLVQVGTRTEGKYTLPAYAEVITTISRRPVFIVGINKTFEGDIIEKIALYTAGAYQCASGETVRAFATTEELARKLQRHEGK
jgi:hypothetical protein